MSDQRRRVVPVPGSVTGRLLAVSRRHRGPVGQLMVLTPLAAAWLLLFCWWALLMLVGIAVWQVSTAVRRVRARSSGRRATAAKWPVPRSLHLVG